MHGKKERTNVSKVLEKTKTIVRRGMLGKEKSDLTKDTLPK